MEKGLLTAHISWKRPDIDGYYSLPQIADEGGELHFIIWSANHNCFDKAHALKLVYTKPANR